MAETFNYFNPTRYLLSQNWKNAIQAIINAQDTFSGVYSQLTDKSNATMLQKMIRQIGQRLKEPTNEELKKEVLFELTKNIDRFIKDTSFVNMLELSGAEPYQIDQVIKRVEDFVKQAYDSIQAGSEEKFDIKSVLNAPLTKTIFGGVKVASPAIMNSIFGAFSPLASFAGGAALKVADKLGMNKYFSELNPFKKNLGNQTRSQGQETGNQGTSNIRQEGNQGTSNVNIAGGLFDFFNTGAFKAAWTRKVLAILQGKTTESNSSSGFFSNLLSGFKGMIAKLIAIFGSAITFILSKFGSLGKTAASIAPKVGSFLTSAVGSTLIGTAAIGGAAVMGGMLNNAWTQEAMNYDKLSDANDAAAFQNFLKVNNMNRIKKGLPPVGVHAPDTTNNISSTSSTQVTTAKTTVDAINKVGDKIDKSVQTEKKAENTNTIQYVLKKNIDDPFIDLLNTGQISVDT